jgi:cell division protein FtsI (penicillin-binding protein 3)
MTPITQATMAYGYGLTASALQIAQAYAAIGNRGQLIPLPSNGGQQEARRAARRS